MVRRLLVGLLVLGIAGVAVAAPARAPRDLKIGVLLDPHGRGDRALTDAVFAGVDAARKHGRVVVVALTAPREEDLGPSIDFLAAETPDLIVGLGPLYAEPFRAAAARHRHARFLLLDAELPGVSQVRSVAFNVEEAGFLAGVAAAVSSKRGRVGFVGAMETPVSQALECGWQTGVRWATQERYLAVRGRTAYVGATPDAYADVSGAEEVTRAMIADHGSDVVYAAAGDASVGVIAATRHAKVKAIGADADRSHLGRDAVITSARKRVDHAVESAIADVRRDQFDGGVRVMNLANRGVDLVLPGALTPSTVKLVDKARRAVVVGATPACVREEDLAPAWNFPPRPAG